MSYKEQLKRQILDDEKYQTILSCVDNDIKNQIELIINSFLENAGESLDGLKILMENRDIQDRIRKISNKGN